MSWSPWENAFITDLFRKEIRGCGSVIQTNVLEKMNHHPDAEHILKLYTPAQIVAKVRYEKKKYLDSSKAL